MSILGYPGTISGVVIPLVDLRAQHARIGDEVEAAATRVLRSGRYALGPEVEAFENDFAAYCEAPHAVGVNSGTSALVVALTACGIGPGDEVITVPFTFVATVSTILQVGAQVRFVDVVSPFLTMDPAALEQAVTSRTKAIVPVHLYGQPADMDPILEVARRHHLVVIEDAAQAVGARYRGRRVGSLGDMACFSFYPSKNLSAAGEGGMIVTNDRERALAARRLRDWGQVDHPRHVLRGGNYRLDGIQAAILRTKLAYLDEWTRSRQRLAEHYTAALQATVETPTVMPYAEHTFNVYAARSPNRDAIRDALSAIQVQTAVHYSTPVHLQSGYTDLGYGSGDFGQSEQAAREVFSLPIYPELSDEQQRTVIDGIRHAAA